MKNRLSYSDVNARTSAVLEAIVTSKEWGRRARTFSSLDWIDAREAFRHVFDAYEGHDGEVWLGILEWAFIEEMRSRGSDLTADAATVDRIIARLAGRSDTELTR